MSNRAVLVVDDDDTTRDLLRVVLRRHGASVEVAADGETAIERLRSAEFDTVILDLMLPKKNGFQVAQVVHSLDPPPQLIVVSALSRDFYDRFPEGTVMLQKPFEVDHLAAALTRDATPAPRSS